MTFVKLIIYGIDLKRNELIVSECKMISPALEPRLYYDDIRKSKDKSKRYMKQFNNKINWISSNKQQVLENLLNYLKINLPMKEISNIKQKNIL